MVQERLQKPDDIKIFILYLMYNIGMPLEYELINDVVVQDGIVAGIDFAVEFANLLENGNIREIKKDNALKYELSERGIQIVESLQTDLASSIRTKGLNSAMRLLNFRERGSDVKTRYEYREDGRYNLYCEIVDKGEAIFEIKVIAEDEARLELMQYNFDSKPETIYKGVLTFLTGKSDYFLS